MLNALEMTGRTLKNTTMVVNGAGAAAAIACLELFTAMGFTKENITLCDSRGVVYRGREAGMNQWKSAHAVDTDARTLGRRHERLRRVLRRVGRWRGQSLKW